MSSLNDKLETARNVIFSADLPIKMTPLVKALGLKFYLAPESWTDSKSGMIIKDDDNDQAGFSVYINRHHSHVRQRFTLAHEIAHYILHENLIGDGIFDNALYRSNQPHKIETQANNLAAELLVPTVRLKEDLKGRKKITDCIIGELADKYGVSRQAMSIKINDIVRLRSIALKRPEPKIDPADIEEIAALL